MRRRSERNISNEPKLFKTDVVGVGPYCIEFPDGEIVTTRSERRQFLLAAAPELLEALRTVVTMFQFVDMNSVEEAIMQRAVEAIRKAEGSEG